MAVEDKTLVCVDCGEGFLHSAQDQERYAELGFSNEPKRCRGCREKRKARSSSSSYDRPQRDARESHEAVCAECGVTTTVPFKPSGDRPVYCRDCFRSKRQ